MDQQKTDEMLDEMAAMRISLDEYKELTQRLTQHNATLKQENQTLNQNYSALLRAKPAHTCLKIEDGEERQDRKSELEENGKRKRMEDGGDVRGEDRELGFSLGSSNYGIVGNKNTGCSITISTAPSHQHEKTFAEELEGYGYLTENRVELTRRAVIKTAKGIQESVSDMEKMEGMTSHILSQIKSRTQNGQNTPRDDNVLYKGVIVMANRLSTEAEAFRIRVGAARADMEIKMRGCKDA